MKRSTLPQIYPQRSVETEYISKIILSLWLLLKGFVNPKINNSLCIYSLLCRWSVKCAHLICNIVFEFCQTIRTFHDLLCMFSLSRRAIDSFLSLQGSKIFGVPEVPIRLKSNLTCSQQTNKNKTKNPSKFKPLTGMLAPGGGLSHSQPYRPPDGSFSRSFFIHGSSPVYICIVCFVLLHFVIF